MHAKNILIVVLAFGMAEYFDGNGGRTLLPKPH
jgi:hypothetical protein